MQEALPHPPGHFWPEHSPSFVDSDAGWASGADLGQRPDVTQVGRGDLLRSRLGLRISPTDSCSSFRKPWAPVRVLPWACAGCASAAALAAAATARLQTQMGVAARGAEVADSLLETPAGTLWRTPSFSRAAVTLLAGLNLCDVLPQDSEAAAAAAQRARDSAEYVLFEGSWAAARQDAAAQVAAATMGINAATH